MQKEEKWTNRLTFILAAVGSAVGLGNAWRFPGLCAKHGGGAFLIVYVIAMIVIGIPMLSMEISIGRRTKSGAPIAFKKLNKKAEAVGWAATTNAFFIVTYYAVVFAWVIAMMFAAVKFGSLTPDEASNFWAEKMIQTNGTTSFANGGWKIPLHIIPAFLAAWGLIYYCIRNGASSVSKVVKYTVFIPVILLLIMAIKGLTMENAGLALSTLFVPKFEALKNFDLWIDAVGQVFYSLSIMMAIMFAYGSFLDDTSNIAADCIIIAFSDLLVSVLSGIVLFTTMYGTGMDTSNMSDSGIATAFMIYPRSLVTLTNTPWINSLFSVFFYGTLVTLAIDSAFSIVEGVSKAVSQKFALNKNKTTIVIVCIAAVISLVYITKAGLGWLDIIDKWCNYYTMIVIGVFECIVVGWVFKSRRVVDEINRNTKKYKMPYWWFNTAIKYIAPLVLIIFVSYQVYTLVTGGGRYNLDYDLHAELIAGWGVTILCFVSGFIVKALIKKNKKLGALVEKAEAEDDIEWN